MLISLINSAEIGDCYGFNLIAAQLKELKKGNVINFNTQNEENTN